MLYITGGRAAIECALTLGLDPALRALLEERLAGIPDEVLALTDYLVVERRDGERDLLNTTGFSPLAGKDSTRFGEPGFVPAWDWLADRGGWFEMIVGTSNEACLVLLVEDAGEDPLRCMCRDFTSHGNGVP